MTDGLLVKHGWVENLTDGRTDRLTWLGQKRDEWMDGRKNSKNGNGFTDGKFF